MVRLLMACFVLSLGVGVASPWVKSGGLDLVCSVGGAIKLVAAADPGPASTVRSFALDCPLCSVAGSPPPRLALAVALVVPQTPALRPAPAAPRARFTAGPLPPRGPPTLFVS